MFHKLCIIIAFILSSLSVQAQDVLTLSDCYTSAVKNHPLQAKKEFLNAQNSIEQEVLGIRKLPKFDLSGQATYQSDVVHLPISLPNIAIESPNKEQYKATITASQLIYNGGLIDAQLNINKADLEAKKQEVTVQVNQLKSQINQLYFSVLLLEQTDEVLEKNMQQLQDKIIELNKLTKNGIAPENASDPLLIKVLELQQKLTESEANKSQLIKKLSLLIGKPITTATQFKFPEIYISGHQNKRPELALFDLQKESINQNINLLKKTNYPKVSAFGTGGFGNPGLNMLDNSLQEFFIVGIKTHWNIFDWNANKKQQQALAINKDIIDNQKELFKWQQSIEVASHFSEITKYNTLLNSDDELISLQEKIVETASKQLKHDLITTADYTAEVNKLLLAQINQKNHKIQMLLAKANYQIVQFE